MLVGPPWTDLVWSNLRSKESLVGLNYYTKENTDDVPRMHTTLMPGKHYPHITWAHVMLRVQLGCDRGFNIEFYGAHSHLCHSAYVTWSPVELWSAHAPARLSRSGCRTFRETWPACRVLFRNCYQFTEMEEVLIQKVRQRTFRMTLSPVYRDMDMRANAWEEISQGVQNKTQVLCIYLHVYLFQLSFRGKF